MVNRRKIRNLVRELLERHRILHPPVPVEAIAREEGILIRYEPFKNASRDLSGMLYHDGKITVIGVNALEAPTRRRFTVAHELGHYFLGHVKKRVHLDEKVPLTLAPVYKFRDQESQGGKVFEEVEANTFAAELLMPVHFVEREIDKLEDVPDADEVIESLARRFDVSIQAMTVRLTALNYLRT